MNRYLRQINILLRNQAVKEQYVRLLRTLEEDETEASGRGAADAVKWEQPGWLEKREAEIVDTVICLPGRKQELLKTGEGNGILWLTDWAEDMRGLVKEGQAVLVCLHEGNREQDFNEAMYACEGPEGLDLDYLERVYRRFHKLPWDILDTKRCHIRETAEEDLESFYRIYSEPSITDYMENLYPDREQELQYIRDYRERVYGFYGFGIWTVELRETGEVIGRAGLSLRECFEEPELGFVIGVPWQGKGIATEVCEAVLEYGRTELGFERVQALVEPENEVSLHLCDKLGFDTGSMTTVNGTVYRYCVKNLS